MAARFLWHTELPTPATCRADSRRTVHDECRFGNLGLIALPARFALHHLEDGVDPVAMGSEAEDRDADPEHAVEGGG